MNTYTIYTSEISEAIKEANKIRLQNKNVWYVLNFVYFDVTIKCFNTWLQKSNKGYFNNSMEQSIKQFKDNLLHGLNYIDNFKKGMK